MKNTLPGQINPPLRGLSNVFDKIKNDQKLETEDIDVLTTFIDQFTTVSTHRPTVGEKIVSQVKEVNTHHHTHTCYKKGNSCRFGFPRPPAPYTIISRPVGEMEAADRKKLFKKLNDTISKVMGKRKQEVILDTIVMLDGVEKHLLKMHSDFYDSTESLIAERMAEVE